MANTGWCLVIFCTVLLLPAASAGDNEEGPPHWGRRMNNRLLYAEPAGALVEFKCPAEGNPHPSIDWLKNNQPFTKRPSGTIGKHRWTLKLETVVDADKGNYTCVISNQYGQIRWTFILDVVSRGPMAPPLITNPPANTTITYGQNATLHCKIMSDAQPHLQWVKHYKVNGSYFNKDNDPYVVNIKNSGVTEKEPDILRLNNATDETAGWYTCVAGNAYGVTHHSAWVTVVPRKCDGPYIHSDSDNDPLDRFVTTAMSLKMGSRPIESDSTSVVAPIAFSVVVALATCVHICLY